MPARWPCLASHVHGMFDSVVIYIYSYHHDLNRQVNLGLLVWDKELTDLRYYEARDEQDHADGFKQRLDDLRKRGTLHGQEIEDALEYFLERGGGGYQSFTVPERIEAGSFEDAARKVVAASEHGLALVIPGSPGG